MNKFFRCARNVALKSPSRFRLGAVLVKKHNIISTGFNLMWRTHPVMDQLNAELDFTIGTHAEIKCCINLSPEALFNSDIYVYRVLKNCQPALAKPCKICQKYLLKCGISRAFYTLDKSSYGELIF